MIELVDMFDEKWFVNHDSIVAIHKKDGKAYDVYVGYGLRIQMMGNHIDLIHKIMECRKWGGR